eukprot:4866115-Prymnesium_polylepis.2
MFALFISTSAAVATPALAVPPARTYEEAVQTACRSFAIVGVCAFGWAAGEAGPRAGFRSARRWGGVSAGFAGGRALMQVVRQTDDEWCAVAGACAGGVLGATSLHQIPARVAVFAVAAFLLETQLAPRVRDGISALDSAASARPAPKARVVRKQPPSRSASPWGKVQRLVDSLNGELGHY